MAFVKCNHTLREYVKWHYQDVRFLAEKEMFGSGDKGRYIFVSMEVWEKMGIEKKETRLTIGNNWWWKKDGDYYIADRSLHGKNRVTLEVDSKEDYESTK